MGKKPAIRFEGYTEDWEQCKVGDLIEDYVEKTIVQNQYPVLTSSQQQGIVFQEEYFADRQVTTNDNIGYFVLPFGYFTYRSRSDTDVFVFNRNNLIDKGIISYYYPVFSPKNCDSNFLIRRLNYGIKKQLTMAAEGTGQKVLAYSKFKNIVVNVPTIDEQIRIGELFEKLDHLITLHQSNYEKMVATKKAMLEKLFPQGEAKVPAIRFDGFVGDWEKKPLSAIIIPYSDPVEVPHSGYERLGIRSHGKGVFHEYVEAGKEITTAQLHRVAAHNFIVNITFAWEHAVAVTRDEDAGKLVSHRFPQFSMADGIYDQFLKYLILDERFHHHLFLSSPGGAGRNRVLKIPEMLEYEMLIPDIEEQKQIAGYLNSLDDLIELYRIRIEKLKNIKAACLQGMLV